MILASLLMGLAALVGTLRASAEDEGAFVELFSTPLAGDPAEEVLYVHADRGPRGDELHVISHRKTLGVFGLEEGRAVVLEAPRIRLPDALEPGESWVISENSIGTAAFAEGSTVYHRIIPEGPDVTREGSWGLLASPDGSTLFFVRGGSEIEHPGRFAVVRADAQTVEHDTPMLPRIHPSRNGAAFVVQAGKSELYRAGVPPIRLPPGGTLYLQPAAQWVVHELPDRVELLRLLEDGVAAAPASTAPPLMAVEFEGNHVLLVSRTRAELVSLATTVPGNAVEELFGVDATAGHRFSSAALRPGDDGVPWVALGELAVRVPQMALPDSPVPRASAVVRAVNPAGVVVERWSVEISAWRASTPLVQWSVEGRLLASTVDRLLASELPLR
jgi:hypothetical protein